MRTPTQQQWDHCAEVLTPEVVRQIRKCDISVYRWAKMLDVSDTTIMRVRRRTRDADRKPMGGDRRSKHWR